MCVHWANAERLGTVEKDWHVLEKMWTRRQKTASKYLIWILNWICATKRYHRSEFPVSSPFNDGFQIIVSVWWWNDVNGSEHSSAGGGHVLLCERLRWESDEQNNSQWNNSVRMEIMKGFSPNSIKSVCVRNQNNGKNVWSSTNESWFCWISLSNSNEILSSQAWTN